MIKQLVAAAALMFTACTPQASATPPAGPAASREASRQARPPAGLTWLVISQINSAYDDPDDPTNRPALISEASEGVLTSRDIDADGVADWIVTWPDSSQFCGTGGCRVTVYRSVEEKLQRIFDRQVLDVLEITRIEGETRIESSFHHGSCDEQRTDCRLAWGLDRATGRLVPRPSLNGDTFSSQSEETPIDGIWSPEA